MNRNDRSKEKSGGCLKRKFETAPASAHRQRLGLPVKSYGTVNAEKRNYLEHPERLLLLSKEGLTA